MTKQSMNALQELLVLEQEARDFGFEWPNVDMILDQVVSECKEIKDAIGEGESLRRIQEEVGDLLHSVISLSIFLDLEIESILAATSKKFSVRLEALKNVSRNKGHDTLKGQDVDYMLDLWRRAKKEAEDN